MLARHDRRENATCRGNTRNQHSKASDAIDFRGIRRICCALSYHHSHVDRIKDKREKKNVSRRRIEQQLKRNRPPASNIRARPRARPGQLSRNEATGQVDARDGICASRGTPAECILRVADVKRLKGPETRPTCSVTSITSSKFLRGEASLSMRLLSRLVLQLLPLSTSGSCWRDIFHSFDKRDESCGRIGRLRHGDAAEKDEDPLKCRTRPSKCKFVEVVLFFYRDLYLNLSIFCLVNRFSWQVNFWHIVSS